MELPPKIRQPFVREPRPRDPRRRRIKISLWWGRFWLLLTFGALVATYVAAIRYMPADRVNIVRLKAACGIAVLWETTLVIAIWMRHYWARLILIFLLATGVLAFAAIVPILHLQRPRNPKAYLEKVELCVAMHALALGMLVACKPIGKLTNRSYQ